MAIAVTATQGGAGAANGMLLRVFVLTQAKPVAQQTGGNANAAFAGTNALATGTVQQASSHVYGALSYGSFSAVPTGSNSTVIDDISDSTNSESYVTFKNNAPSTGSQSIGVTTSSSTGGPVAWAELLAAGTLTEDASAPAVVSTTSATTVTSASFTPPGGSLIVALTSTNGGATQVTMTVSDGTLTWTEVVKNNPSGGDYAGVWIADVPAGAVLLQRQQSTAWLSRNRQQQDAAGSSPPAFNAQASNSLTGVAHTVQPTLVIPATAKAGDWAIFAAGFFTFTPTNPGISFSSSAGTAWTTICGGFQQSPAVSGLQQFGQVWIRQLTPADIGSTITLGFTGTQGSTDQFWWDVGVATWTGFTGYDVNQTLNGVNANICPASVVGLNGEWSVTVGAIAVAGSGTINGMPAGTATQRLNAVTAGIALAISDSNGSIGPAPAVAGGRAFSTSSTAGGDQWVTFTITLTTAQPPPVPPPIQPQAQQAAAWNYQHRQQQDVVGPPAATLTDQAAAAEALAVSVSSIIKVGEAGIAGGNGTSPAQITYSSSSGNTLIITGHLFDNNLGVFVAPTSITDTAGNVWQVSVNSAQSALTAQTPPLASITDPSDGASAHQADFIAWCVKAQPVTSVTIAWEGGVSTWRRLTLSEFSGVAQFDNSWAGGSGSSVSSVTSGPVTVNGPGELVVGSLDFGGGGVSSLPSGWTGFATQGSANDQGYIVSPATGPYSPVWADTVANSWAGSLAVFSPVPLSVVQNQQSASWNYQHRQQRDTAQAAQGQAITLADQAAAAEQLQVSTAVEQPQQSTAWLRQNKQQQDIVQMLPVSVADQAAASDTLVVAQTNWQQNQQVAAWNYQHRQQQDASPPGTFITLADQAAASEQLTVTVAVPLAEQAAVVDQIAVSTAVEQPQQSASWNYLFRQQQDAGFTVAFITLADQAAAGETISPAVAAALGDQAAAGETLAVAAAVPVAEQAAAGESLSAASAVSLAEQAAAGESVVVQTPFSIPLPEQAAAAEALAVSRTAPGSTGNQAWLAQAWPLRWAIMQVSPFRWTVQTAPYRWRILMSVFPPVAAVSLEDVNVEWTSALAGTKIDPTGQTAGQPLLSVNFAFPVSSGNMLAPAQPVAWFAGSWLLGGNAAFYVAQCLVGPPPGVVRLTSGQVYDVWCQILGSPEQPARFAGQLSVY